MTPALAPRRHAGPPPAAPRAARRRGPRATAPFRFAPALETLSRDAIAALQLTRLRATLARAYARVAPFRAKCEAAGAEPGDLHRLEDLARFPFTTKADLRAAYPFGLFAVPRPQVVRLHDLRPRS